MGGQEPPGVECGRARPIGGRNRPRGVRSPGLGATGALVLWEPSARPRDALREVLRVIAGDLEPSL
jgi:hypothetical protein